MSLVRPRRDFFGRASLPRLYLNTGERGRARAA
jgi:hypothetical protein